MARPAVSPAGGARRVEWRGFGPWRLEARAFLELFALCGVAVAQPVFDLLAKNAGVFVTLQTNGLQVVSLSLLVVLGPPLALWAVEVLVGLAVPKLRAGAHAVLAAGVVAVIGVEAIKRATDLPARAVLGLAAVLAIAGGVLVWRSALVRTWLRFLAIAPVIFAVLFLFTSSVTAVVFENDVASAQGVEVKRPERIVMLVFDELPVGSLLDGSGHVDETLFPNFARLENESTWYRNHTTVAPYTDQAVPAILTGRYPDDGYRAPVAANYPESLFTLLGGIYRMNVFETVTKLCPTGVCTTEHDQGDADFGELVDTTYTLWSDFATPRRQLVAVNPAKTHSDQNPLDTASAFVDSLGRADRPELDFLHVLLPHQPWHLRPTGQDDGWSDSQPGMAFELYWPNAWNASSGRQRHLLQVQVADQVLGEVVARLNQLDEYQDSVLVVTSDHGIAFTPDQSYRGVSPTNYPELLWTPLFVHAPRQSTAVVDDGPAESVDVLPTIADLIDADVPWDLDGTSLLREHSGSATVRVSPWTLNRVEPPPGEDHITFPRAPGFASVMAARASTATGPPDLRLYQLGDYGALVGREAAPLVGNPSSGYSARITGPATKTVDPDAHRIPWSFVRGRIDEASSGVPLAITVNGVVAGLAETYDPKAGRAPAEFWSTLAPQLFERGRNELGVFVIAGTPAAPRLLPVTVRT
jgi:arylsulfatase A-like enzyme